jgi:hypothetical protein
MSVNIISDFPPDDLKELLNVIAEQKEKEYVHIDSFSRYGNSGSKLHLVFFTKDKRQGVPYLLKTFSGKEHGKDAQEEIAATRRLRDIVHDARGDLFYTDSLSGILTEYHGEDKPDGKILEPFTFKDIMYKSNEFSGKYVDDERICEIIGMIFARFRRAYFDPVKEDRDIPAVYEEYIRNDVTRAIITSLTKNDLKKESIEIFGQRQLNPIYVYDHLLPRKDVTMSLIHGDFHPDNIVMNSENCPRIIDFRWSKKHDVYLDFAMFEMSARYWQDRTVCFYMDKETKDKIEEGLLSDEVDYDSLLSLTENERVKRMLIIVREIRKHCKEILGERYNFEDYIFAQFIVLYGLQKFAWEYNPYRVVPALGSLGGKLKDFGLLVPR